MYIVRDKKTKNIIYVNPAPLSQALDGETIYHQYDSKTMEIGKTDLPVLPEHFTIDSQNMICELSLSEQSQKGIIQLTPFQKVVGEGADEKIVIKSLEERVKEGLLELSPNQKIENDHIVTYTNEEMFNKRFIDLDEYKKRKIKELSDLAFTIRESIIPDYKIANACMGIYSEPDSSNIKATVQAFRDEFCNLKKQVETAQDVNIAAAVKENYPRDIVRAGT